MKDEILKIMQLPPFICCALALKTPHSQGDAGGYAASLNWDPGRRALLHSASCALFCTLERSTVHSLTLAGFFVFFQSVAIFD